MSISVAGQGNLAIDRAAREVGRDPREIRRIFLIPGAFTSTNQAPATDTDQSIVGAPDHWVEVLTHFALALLPTHTCEMPDATEWLAARI